MRRASILLAGTALAVALGATAFAQTGPGTKSPGDRFRTQFFERLDANKDGKITKPEYEAARAAEFKAADKKFEYRIYQDFPGGHTMNRSDVPLARESRREVWAFLAKHLK